VNAAGGWPRITVVTPVYNGGEFLEEAIRSVLSQCYPNLEYMIVDGGSTDNSVEIIRKYEGRLAYWVSEPDRGNPDAINKGWARSTGEFLAWLNADDLYEPNVLRDAASFLSAHPRVGMVCGSVLQVDGRNTRRVLWREEALHRPLEMSLRDMVSPGTTAAFIRRRAIEETGPLDPKLLYWIDPELWIRIGLSWDLGHVPRDWLRFRLHKGSKTCSAPKLFVEEQIAVPAPITAAARQGVIAATLRLARWHAFGGDRLRAAARYQAAWRYSPLLTCRALLRSSHALGLLHSLFGRSAIWNRIAMWRRSAKAPGSRPF